MDQVPTTGACAENWPKSRLDDLARESDRMTSAVCFKCGTDKTSPLLACGACGQTPRHEGALALSLVLSEHLSTKVQLAHFAHEIKNHLRLSATSAKLAEAREALKDPQLIAMLGGASAAAAPAAPPTRSPQRQAGARSTPQAPASAGFMKPMQTSALHRNTHLLEQVVRGGFKKGVSRLSDYFND